ncbi:MAG: glycosyltransferase family 4 protein [Eubacterium callanderi]|uniref:glycosyltransferase family 4 protein n=2 Tax=Eubacterium callanderi TaxID=53442 RepID=UPI0029F5ADD7|nr:glycosyltransferase family 4 protein [Eubacterium callanderi]
MIINKILITGNNILAVCYTRKELIERLLRDGWKVHLLIPKENIEKIQEFEQKGCKIDYIKINSHGTNPCEDLILIYKYKQKLIELAPDIVMTFTIKPTLYCGISCNKLRIPFISTITGLGIAVENPSVKQKLIILLYKMTFKKVRCVFFQNAKNKYFFDKHNIKIKRQKLVPGSGVNLDAHCYEPYPEKDDTIRFLFIGRMMKDKGIDELLAAAQRIKEKHDHVFFDLIGFCEADYKGKAQLETLHKQKMINYMGHQDAIHDHIKAHHALLHPSYHEGMANVLLEAAACGRPVLASNIPGCQEAFDEGITGFGFEPRNVDDLVRAIEKFIALPYEQKQAMGIAGRKKMEQEFDRQIVVDAYMEEIENILKNKHQ